MPEKIVFFQVKMWFHIGYVSAIGEEDCHCSVILTLAVVTHVCVAYKPCMRKHIAESDALQHWFVSLFHIWHLRNFVVVARYNTKL